MNTITITGLSDGYFEEAVNLVLKADLDTQDEIEHHLKHIDAHYIALDNKRVVGVIGWYQDTVSYATKVMGKKFPGTHAYWIGFFTVDEAYRGKGIGFALLKHLEKVVSDKGAHELWVSSVPETKEYYQKHGYRIFMEGKINGNDKFFCVKNIVRSIN